jgi:hypothetical protein
MFTWHKRYSLKMVLYFTQLKKVYALHCKKKHEFANLSHIYYSLAIGILKSLIVN